MKRLIDNPGILITLIMFIAAFSAGNYASAQEKEGSVPDGKSSISIHISKDDNGKMIKFDTTFEAGSDFDVDAFLDEKGIGMKQPHPDADRDFEMFNFDFPEMDEPFTQFPDSLLNDSLMFRLQRRWEDLSESFPKCPDMEGDFRIEAPGQGQCPRRSDADRKNNEMPGCCPLYHDNPQGMMFPQLPGMDLAPFIGYGHPEKIIVHKKRHGKKVVITFNDDMESYMDDAMAIPGNFRCPGMEQHHRYIKTRPGHREQMEMKVKKSKPAQKDKQVIIIEKRSEEEQE